MTTNGDVLHETKAALLEVGDEAGVENERKLLRLRDAATNYVRQARELQALVEARILEWMELNACDIVISDSERLYVGTTKVTKSIDDQGILMAVLEAGNGNLELLTTGHGGMLASQPWKHGAVIDLIGADRAKGLFEITVKLDLKTGKPAKSVKVADNRFTRQKS